MKHLSGGTALAAAVLLLASACSGEVGGSEDKSEAGTLKVGYVSPQTGPLASFGEADSFVVDQMKDYFEDNELKVGDESYKVEIIVKDAQSDSTRAGEVAADLINNDGVDIVMAASTPDIVNPVSEQCEANSVPCITTVAPWQTVAFREGPPDPVDLSYTHHFFWGLEDIAGVYGDIWSQVDTNKKAGGLFPNDPDGQAWSANLPDLMADTGVTIEDPGLYPNGTQDFSAQIAALKGNDILLGVPIPPDFTTFWKQANQQGYNPKVATIGKALLFPSVIEGIGDIANNLATEVWWHPTVPFKSSLTGQTAQELADAYEEETGAQWTQNLGFVHALFEVMAAGVTTAGSTDADAIDSALDSLSVDTIAGTVAWGGEGLPPYIAKTPLTGGQWRASDGPHPFELVIVSNSLAPDVPLGGEVEPLN